MTLLDAIRHLDSFDPELTIYAAAPWNADSEVIIAREPDAPGSMPWAVEGRGLRYFLEVFIARDFLEDWKNSLGREPTIEEKCTRLVQYATRDA